MRYDSTFGSWSRLTPDEASERSYALGVAGALGEEHPDEFRRLVQAQSSSLAEMLFDVGWSHAVSLGETLGVPEGEHPDEPEASLIWNRLVEDPPSSGPRADEFVVG